MPPFPNTSCASSPSGARSGGREQHSALWRCSTTTAARPQMGGRFEKSGQLGPPPQGQVHGRRQKLESMGVPSVVHHRKAPVACSTIITARAARGRRASPLAIHGNPRLWESDHRCCRRAARSSEDEISTTHGSLEVSFGAALAFSLRPTRWH